MSSLHRTALALATLPLFTSSHAHFPFKTTYLFTASVLLSHPTPNSTTPITIPGGIIIPEPILGGTISGPYLTANITSGLTTPRVYRNGTLQESVIDLYGVTDDGVPFTLHETGIGRPDGQVRRLVGFVYMV